MATDYLGITQNILTLISGSGYFRAVIDHEPRSAPTEEGLVCALIGISAEPTTSGMASVSMRVEVVVRVMLNGQAEPQGLIDPEVLGAADQIMGLMIANWRLPLAAGVRQVDIFGEAGEKLRTVAGWTQIDQTQFRIADVFIPVLTNDSWDIGA